MLIPIDDITPEIKYDECIDITKRDKGDIVWENTGIHPSMACYNSLKEMGFSDVDIYGDKYYTRRMDFKIVVPLCPDIEENDGNAIFGEEILFHDYEGIMENLGLLPVEEIKHLRKNSKMKKQSDKKYTYELKYVYPSKYKNALKRLGYDVENSEYWSNLEKNMKKK